MDSSSWPDLNAARAEVERLAVERSPAPEYPLA